MMGFQNEIGMHDHHKVKVHFKVNGVTQVCPLSSFAYNFGLSKLLTNVFPNPHGERVCHYQHQVNMSYGHVSSL
jgi:hypothetical protein